MVAYARGRIEQVAERPVPPANMNKNGYDYLCDMIVFVKSSILELKDRFIEWGVSGYEKIAELFSRTVNIYKTLVFTDYEKILREREYQQGLLILRRDLNAFIAERM